MAKIRYCWGNSRLWVSPFWPGTTSCLCCTWSASGCGGPPEEGNPTTRADILRENLWKCKAYGAKTTWLTILRHWKDGRTWLLQVTPRRDVNFTSLGGWKDLLLVCDHHLVPEADTPSGFSSPSSLTPATCWCGDMPAAVDEDPVTWRDIRYLHMYAIICERSGPLYHPCRCIQHNSLPQGVSRVISWRCRVDDLHSRLDLSSTAKPVRITWAKCVLPQRHWQLKSTLRWRQLLSYLECNTPDKFLIKAIPENKVQNRLNTAVIHYTCETRLQFSYHILSLQSPSCIFTTLSRLLDGSLVYSLNRDIVFAKYYCY